MVLIATLVIGSLWLVDNINVRRHQEPALKGVMQLIMAQIRADQGSIQTASRDLGATLALERLHSAVFGNIQLARLESGQLLVEQLSAGAVSVSMAMQDEAGELWVLSARFKDFQTNHIRGVFALLARQLSREIATNGTPISETIDRYRQQYNVPIHFLSAIQSSKLMLPRDQYSAPNYFARFDIDGSAAHFYSWMPEADGLIEIGPVVFEQPLRPATIIVISVMAMLLVGIVVYWLVHSFELRLQRLERASSRIASGHLNSRVKVDSVDSVGRLGNAFNKMAEQIQHLMGVQREMIRAVSHELRTPVARMRFGVQMLEDTVEDGYVQKQLGAMDGDLQELDELIDEILTYARLEEGGPILEFKASNILDLVNQVAEETRRRTDEVEVSCEALNTNEEEIFAEIEQRYMHRAIQNLVGNACRYAEGRVCLTYSYADGVCRVDVEDDGPGIPEKDWERIFSPFTRLDDSRTRSSGGYGLGLSIVQRIVYWHSGQAMVSRSKWGGAKMSLVWPKLHHSPS